MQLRFLPIFFIFCFQAAQAQKVVALQHNGVSSFFSDLQPALNAAVNGDTLYLPGRSFSGFTLNKKLAIIGAGHHPDSTLATSKTIINGSITVSSNANNSLISGIQLTSTMYLQPDVSYITIQRCYLQGTIQVYQGIVGLSISESIVGPINGPSINPIGGTPYPTNCLFFNNIFFSYLHLVQNSSIRNNIFLSNNYSNGNDCLIENNVSNVQWSGNNNIFHNNINFGINGNDNYGNQGSGNILSVDFNTLFVAWASPWDYSDDFHLTNPAYNTGGTDGTPIGIYGGTFPWKAGSVPFNPHINLKVVAPSTNSSGNLPVQIRAAAQDH